MHGLPLAYLGGFDLDFGQVHFLQPRICCWLVHLEAWFSVVELEVQVLQIFRSSSHLYEVLQRYVLGRSLIMTHSSVTPSFYDSVAECT